MDIEDIGNTSSDKAATIRPIVHTVKRKREESPPQEAQNWREALGPPPPFGTTKVTYINIARDLWPFFTLL